MLSHSLGVRVVALHPQRQRFDALEEEERVERRERSAGVAQQHRADATDVGRWAERVGPDNTVVARVRQGLRVLEREHLLQLLKL